MDGRASCRSSWPHTFSFSARRYPQITQRSLADCSINLVTPAETKRGLVNDGCALFVHNFDVLVQRLPASLSSVHTGSL